VPADSSAPVALSQFAPDVSQTPRVCGDAHIITAHGRNAVHDPDFRYADADGDAGAKTRKLRFAPRLAVLSLCCSMAYHIDIDGRADFPCRAEEACGDDACRACAASRPRMSRTILSNALGTCYYYKTLFIHQEGQASGVPGCDEPTWNANARAEISVLL
jgi:hypothetical protein